MAKQYGKLKIYANKPGTVAEGIQTLRAIEDAYLMLYATELHIEFLLETYSGRRRFRFDMPLPFYPYAPGLTSRHNLLSPEDVRKTMLLPEDVLLIGSVQFESPGFWEFLGTLNPLDQLRKYVQDRHERKKDVAYRNEMERRKLQNENELLETELFRNRVSALREAGYTAQEVRRLMLPATQALGVVSERQEDGLIEKAILELDETEG